jgi:hypothetical protein
MVVYNLIAQLIGKVNGFGRWWMLPNGQSTAIRSATPATCADRIGGAAGRRQQPARKQPAANSVYLTPRPEDVVAVLPAGRKCSRM